MPPLLSSAHRLPTSTCSIYPPGSQHVFVNSRDADASFNLRAATACARRGPWQGAPSTGPTSALGRTGRVVGSTTMPSKNVSLRRGRFYFYFFSFLLAGFLFSVFLFFSMVLSYTDPPWSQSNMPRLRTTVAGLLARAEVNEYKRGAYKEREKVQKHNDKTKRNHDCTLHRYILWHLAEIKRLCVIRPAYFEQSAWTQVKTLRRQP